MLAERPHTINLPKSGKAVSHIEHAFPNPRHLAQQWISKLEAALNSRDVSRLATIMHGDCWWRDHLAFEWDFHTVHGLDNLSEFISKHMEAANPWKFKLNESGRFVPKLVTPMEGLDWIESMFSFETKRARGSGMMRIVQGSDGTWKGYMVYTVVKELKGLEEKVGNRREHGGSNSLLGGNIRGNWKERRDHQIDFLDEEPQVLIVGAGKAMSLNARQRQHG